jgi:putative restriction endonuclease
VPIPGESPEAIAERRRYVTRDVQQRLHQRVFRGLVIRAYAGQRSICQLRRRELLDAAHILSDTDPRGQPIIPNGLAMCSVHHTAYHTNVIGISPDFVIREMAAAGDDRGAWCARRVRRRRPLLLRIAN